MKATRTGVAIIAVLFALGIGLMLRFSRALTVDRAAVHAALFAPYASALQSGDIEGAWTRYTTERYRARHPLPVYLGTFEERARAHGHLATIECPTMTGVRRMRSGVFIVATCDVRYDDGSAHHVTYSVVQDAGRFVIDIAIENRVAAAW